MSYLKKKIHKAAKKTKKKPNNRQKKQTNKKPNNYTFIHYMHMQRIRTRDLLKFVKIIFKALLKSLL